MYSVLHSVYSVLHSVYSVLHSVYSVLHSVYSVLHSVLHTCAYTEYESMVCIHTFIISLLIDFIGLPSSPNDFMLCSFPILYGRLYRSNTVWQTIQKQYCMADYTEAIQYTLLTTLLTTLYTTSAILTNSKTCQQYLKGHEETGWIIKISLLLY